MLQRQLVEFSSPRLVKIRILVRANASVTSVGDEHAVRCRGELGRVRVDLHIHADPDLTVAHGIARAVVERVTARLGGICEVLVQIGAGERHAPASSALSKPERPLESHEASGSPPSQDSR